GTSARTRGNGRTARAVALSSPIPKVELREEGAHRLSAVADRVLLGRGHLRGGARLARGNERRGITETARAASRVENPAFPCAVANQGARVVRVAHVHDHAAITRATACVGNAGKRPQQLVEIGLIARTLARETRGPDTRSTVER